MGSQKLYSILPLMDHLTSEICRIVKWAEPLMAFPWPRLDSKGPLPGGPGGPHLAEKRAVSSARPCRGERGPGRTSGPALRLHGVLCHRLRERGVHEHEEPFLPQATRESLPGGQWASSTAGWVDQC